MSKFNPLEHLHSISDEQIQHVIDTLNSKHQITDSEEPFNSYYLILKNWSPECTAYLMDKGYKGEYLLIQRDWKKEGDPTTYALYNPDELNFWE